MPKFYMVTARKKIFFPIFFLGGGARALCSPVSYAYGFVDNGCICTAYRHCLCSRQVCSYVWWWRCMRNKALQRRCGNSSKRRRQRRRRNIQLNCLQFQSVRADACRPTCKHDERYTATNTISVNFISTRCNFTDARISTGGAVLSIVHRCSFSDITKACVGYTAGRKQVR